MSFSGYFSVKPAINFVPFVGRLKGKARKFQVEKGLVEKRYKQGLSDFDMGFKKKEILDVKGKKTFLVGGVKLEKFYD